jgi:hypothetical protein
MTLLEDVKQELADHMIPHPDWIDKELGPEAALFYAYQVAEVIMPIAVAACVSLNVDPNEEQPVLSELLNGCAAAYVGYAHALVALAVLPPEAEEAIRVAATS